MTQVFVRFAPSPTGFLHVGNVRTALVNWLFARKAGGRFLLRIDDTDRERSEDRYVDAIQEDLRWLGLEWDSFAKQSDYFDLYEQARQKLIADGRLYACYETPEELEIKRKMQVSRGLPPIYDRSALKLTDVQKQAYEAEGRKAHWRFKLNHAPIEWDDLIRGPVRFEGQNLADPVLYRGDGVPLFTLSTSVDDGQMGITHIMRGEDHVSNTAIQVQIMEALGYKAPVFGHIALLQMKGGKLSKREGGGDIRSLREGGIFSHVINSYLAKIGTSDAIALADSMQGLIDGFDTAKFGRAMANYDPEELQRLNEKLLHHLSYADVQKQLDAATQQAVDESFWNSVRSNLKSVDELKLWADICKQGIVQHNDPDDAEFLALAAELLPEGEITDATWDEWINRIKAACDRKGKQLFMPLRMALTARHDGPELKHVLPLIGREVAKARLLGKAA